MKTKIIAMYLPQYHQIPENDEFWGDGFTDWVTVKNAKPLFKGHCQPRVPLNGNYYDLSQKESVAWQAKIAKEYGIYGFGIYHYWFNNKQNLLTKPAEIIQSNKDIDINYFYAWDNISWKRSWSNVKEAGNAWAPAVESKLQIKNGPAILIPYELGMEEDWKKHYDYLLPYFKDKRYIKVNNKPIFIIFHKDEMIDRMCRYWNKLAQYDGFEGVFFIFRYDDKIRSNKDEVIFKYEPQYSGWTNHSIIDKTVSKIENFFRKANELKKYDYDQIWSKIINNAKKMPQCNIYHCGFVSYDDTPRRGVRGICVENSSPDKFKLYIKQLIDISSKQQKEFVFLTAWNEWGEGAYLEPDSVYKYKYLDALKEAIDTAE